MNFIVLNIRFIGKDILDNKDPGHKKIPIPDYTHGTIKEIVSWFVDNGYHLETIRDESTRYFKDKRGAYCIYVFEKNKPDIELNLDKAEKFLDSQNEFEQRLEYRLYSF